MTQEITTTPPPALEGGSLSPRVSKSDEQWELRRASRVRAFEEAREVAHKVRCDRRRAMDDSWQEAARKIWNEIGLLQDDEVRAARLDAEKKAREPHTRGEANPSPPPQEGLVEALEAALALIKDEYSDPRASALEGHPISRVARNVWDQGWAALSHHRAGVKT